MDWLDLARTQAGAISRVQLLECGLTEHQVRGLVRRADLVQLLPSIFSQRSLPTSFMTRAWAAVLWSGGALSHPSAGQIWDLPIVQTPIMHVATEHRRRREVPEGIRIHRLVRGVHGITKVDGLTVTDRRTTIVELLRTEPPSRAVALMDRSIQQRWLEPADLTHAITDGRFRPGNKQLRRLVDALEPGAHAESERVLHRILRIGQLTGWVPQYWVQLSTGWAQVDVAFPGCRLAIEVDGRRYHDEFSDRFESDRTRQNDLQAGGWRVLRFTWRALDSDPATVLAKINQLLGA